MAGMFFSPDGANGPPPKDLKWWAPEEVGDDGTGDAVARQVFAAASAIISNTADREDIIWRNIRMYSGQTRESYWGEASQNPLALARSALSSPYKVNRNVVASVIDTLVALLTATPIKTTILASGGDYARTKKRSQTCEKFCNGVKYNNKFETLAMLSLLSGCVCDIGAVKVFEDEDFPGSIKIESVFPAELIVDELDGLHGEPRQIMQRKVVARDVLKELYPDNDEAIDDLKAVGTGLTHLSLADKVEIVEAWHLPSGPGAKDGKHVVCTESTVLFEEDWKATHFPFAFLRPNLNLFGFWGIGIASDLVGVQYEINMLSQSKQRALYLGSNFMVLVPTGSHINKNHLLNGMGLVLEYDGEKPDWFTPTPVSANVESEIENLIAWAYKRHGVSVLTAQSLKPEGLDSGAALRTFANIQSVRQGPLGKAYQQFHLDVDRLICMTARQIDERRKGGSEKPLEVHVPDAKTIVRIPWKDADPGDGFVTRAYPTNLFADSPAERLAQLGELADKGIIDSDTFMALNPYPDLELYNKIRNAPRDNILKQIDDIIQDGKYRGPEPFQDLHLGLILFQSALLDAEDNDVAEERLAMLQKWMGEAKAYMSPPPMPPPAPAPGMAPPMGAPMPPAGPPMAAPVPPPAVAPPMPPPAPMQQ